MSTDLVLVDDSGDPITTSLIIATESGNEHASVMKLIRDNEADLNEVGGVRFQIDTLETAGGPQRRHTADLDEPAAALLMTYLRNTPKVKDFKKRLVAGFYAMRRRLSAAVPLRGNELMAAGFAEAMKTLEARDSRIHQLEAKATVDAPKVTYVDMYVTDNDLLSFSTVASAHNVQESVLRELLIVKDWIYRQEESRWSNRENKKVTRYRYTEKADKKRYFRRVEVHEAPRFRSEVMHTLKITPQGAEAIARLVAKEVAA